MKGQACIFVTDGILELNIERKTGFVRRIQRKANWQKGKVGVSPCFNMKINKQWRILKALIFAIAYLVGGG